MCRCKKIYPAEEKRIMIRAFIIFICLQTFFVIALCVTAILYLNATDFTWFMPIDIMTLFIAVIILSLIVLIVGWSSASSNMTFAWFFFHLFMFSLLLIELIISWFSSDVKNFMKLARSSWETSTGDERWRKQDQLKCCGFFNSTDMNEGECEPEIPPCNEVFLLKLTALRDVASIALFVDFVFAMFLDFAGCAICFHPDVVTFNEQLEENSIMEALSASSDYLTMSTRLDGKYTL